MNLSERRPNAPQYLGTMPVFELQTPNRTVHALRSLPSTDSLASYTTIDTLNALPRYEVQEDNNVDVITTSVEIDPDNEEPESDITTTPPAVASTKEKKVRKRSGLTKLFSRSALRQESVSPGVRLTQPPHMLKSRSRNIGSGFSLSIPITNDVPVVDMDDISYMQLMSRINILLSGGALKDVQTLLDSEDCLRDRVSFVKLSEARAHKSELLQTSEVIDLGRSASHGDESIFLTVPELNPYSADSDDEASQSSFSGIRRGSLASSCSSSSHKSSLSQRIRERFEKREEWCLLFH